MFDRRPSPETTLFPHIHTPTHSPDWATVGRYPPLRGIRFIVSHWRRRRPRPAYELYHSTLLEGVLGSWFVDLLVVVLSVLWILRAQTSALGWAPPTTTNCGRSEQYLDWLRFAVLFRVLSQPFTLLHGVANYIRRSFWIPAWTYLTTLYNELCSVIGPFSWSRSMKKSGK